LNKLTRGLHSTPLKRWIAWAASVTAILLLLVAAILIKRAEPILKGRVIETLGARFGSKVELDDLQVLINAHMLNQDGAEHRRLRNLVSTAFTPLRIKALRPRIQVITDQLIDSVQERGEMDLIAGQLDKSSDSVEQALGALTRKHLPLE